MCARPGAEHDLPGSPLRALGGAVARECFRASPVDVHLCGRDMATLRTVPYEPLRPDLPVRVTTRPSVGGGSLVAQYRNDSPRYLAVKATLRNPTLGRTEALSLNIPPWA